MSEPVSPRPSRRRRLRLVVWTFVSFTAVLLSAVAVLFSWTRSARFEAWVCRRLADKLDQSIGGRAEVHEFHWRPLSLEGEAGGVVVHGLEGPREEPFAQVERVRARLSILDIWSPRILLRDLEIVRPGIHLIVYPDGSTNQPHPRKPLNAKQPFMDSIFDLEAGRISIAQGFLDYEDRASSFDFQRRYALFDFKLSDASLHMSYIAAEGSNPERYRIDANARDFEVTRGAAPVKVQKAGGDFRASLDLTRDALYVRSLHISSQSRTGSERPKELALEIAGALEHFSHPRWRGQANGEIDLRLLDPVTGYADAPVGIARLDLAGAGQAGQFRVDGGVHVDGASYIANGVTAVGVGIDAHVHADAAQLLLTSVVVRLRQGGRMEGAIALSPWLSPLPGAAAIERAGQSGVRAAPGSMPMTRILPPQIDIPVNGKVTAQFSGVSLDTLLDIVGEPPLQRLGFNTLLSGPATATWTKGDTATLVVGANFSLAPGKLPVPGEVPATGSVDGTYSERNGSVDLRRLELNTPGGQLVARGNLGAYPTTSPTAIAVEFHSRQISDFDTFLRNLGLRRQGKSGVSALPVSLNGEADFHGSWAGSLVDPRLSGSALATQLNIETLPVAGDSGGQPRWVHWDKVEATGSYSAERIDITHGLLQRGPTQIALSGDLVAPPAPAGSRRTSHSPEFTDDSTLRLRVHGAAVPASQLVPLAGRELPITGSIDTRFSLEGPIRSLSGSGWAELKDGDVYGQPVARLHVEGSLANEVMKVASAEIDEAGGSIHARGQINLENNEFELDSRGSAIDVAQIDALRRHNLGAGGRLGFTLSGSGSIKDPRLNAHATFSALALNGESLGPLEFNAKTANRIATFEAVTSVHAAGMTLHGQTALSGDHLTSAQLDFSQFNIGALLAMTHLESLNGESALAGTITVEGPLAKPDALRGEARVKELAVTVAGVHLKSEGGLHATLANAVISLDPLHVTGEETDLRMQGSLALRGRQQLDFASSGSINLKLGEMLDPDLTASGTTTFQVEGHGPLRKPGLRGRIEFQNSSLALEDIPNGLSQLHGTLEFNSDRLEVRSLTAMSGGGQLSVTGYLTYQQGLYADLRVSGKGIRIRYPPGVSSLTDGNFHLQGMQNSLLLSGNVLITRFSISPDLDIAALAAQANAVQPVVSPDAPSNHIRLDVHVVSSPQLNFQNTVAKLAGNVDLHLRGTVASPTLLGSVQITEGNALIAGTRYELQRGTVSFTNPVRIEPNIDLSATAHVSDYDITLGLHGTPAKMSISYRSDPPLPEADVVALLALGRTGDQQRLYTQQQEQQSSNPATDALLGGALNATVSSRVQKLFGAGSVKIDPNYIGALGNSTSRIIVEEQVGRDMTLTYATNVDTTQQQLLQAEIAINRHVSLLVARDESGVFSMVIKATRRFR